MSLPKKGRPSSKIQFRGGRAVTAAEDKIAPTPRTPTTFPVRLRRRRQQLELTQAQLAERVGWTQGRISHLEKGSYSYDPEPETVLTLAKALECDPAALWPGYLAATIPAGAVVLRPDLGRPNTYRPWRQSDLGAVGVATVAAKDLAQLVARLHEQGLALYLLP